MFTWEQEERGDCDCWGSHNKEHTEEVALPQPCPQYHFFIMKMGLGNVMGREKNKIKHETVN